MEDISELRYQRGQVKSKLTRAKRFYDSVDKSNINDVMFEQIESRLERFQPIFEEFAEVQTLIDRHNESNSQIEDKEREDFENAFYLLHAQFKAILSAYSTRQQSEIDSNKSRNSPVNSSSHHTENQSIHYALNNARVKLPTINLPKFDGDYMQWLDFKEAFIGLIHNNQSISDYEKFVYLRSSLEGDACKRIDHLKTTASLYATAWQRLTDRYDNNDKIIKHHLKSIFDQAALEKESHSGLRNLYENITQNLRALEQLEEPTKHWDTIIIYLISSKLDSMTLQEWEKYKGKTLQCQASGDTLMVNEGKPNNKATLEMMSEFLELRCHILENVYDNRNKLSTSHNSNIKSTMASKNKSSNKFIYQSRSESYVAVNNQFSCFFCSKHHTIYQCQNFLKLRPNVRYNEAKQRKLCVNYLRPDHNTDNCKASGCRKCGKRHNTLLHFNTDVNSSITPSIAGGRQDENHLQVRVPQQDVENTSRTSVPNLEQSETLCTIARDSSMFLAILSTAVVRVQDRDGKTHEFRALLDSGAQNSFVTERFCRKLKLRCERTNFSIIGVSQVKTRVEFVTNICLSSRNLGYNNKITCLVLPEITGNLPTVSIDATQLKIPDNLKFNLADPTFNLSGPIDILLGSDIFWELLCVGQVKLGSSLILQNTRLGWVIAGNMSFNTPSSPANIFINCLQAGSIDYSLDNSIKKFWQVEEIEFKQAGSVSEQFCENHFLQNFKRDNEGRFIVAIPFKSNFDQLGNSKEFALQRLFSQEKRLLKNAELYSEYKRVMSEYIELGHMTEIKESNTDKTVNYYLPHHPVVKDTSLTTRVRIVFDAAMKSDNGLSLNDVQYSGPVIQNDLLSIILRFRKHEIVMTADISKMYRMILVQESDRQFQRVFWRNDPSSDVKCYEMNRVVFGTTSAPYLAVRCLYQLGVEHEHSHPEASRVIKNDFYVDDCLTGCNSESQLLELQKNLTNILASGGFQLRKWLCNKPKLCQLFQVDGELESNILQIGEFEANKTLGVMWNATYDTIHYSISDSLRQKTISKRSILSEISQVFDPCGLLGPIIIVAKLLIQTLWQEKIGWDSPLPQHLHTRWAQYRNDLSILNELKIPRHVIISKYKLIELHGFSDASERAYGACIYIRSRNNSDDLLSRLVCAKSRVAPIKKITLPRLELCSALLLAQLIHKVVNSMQIKFNKIFLWSDSTITLSWIRGCPSKWKTFVANRVSEIQRLTDIANWHHVKSCDNPADIISRGMGASELLDSSLWWSGPEWLTSNEALPISSFEMSVDLPEQRNIACTVVIDNFNIFDKFSSLRKLQRVVAYILRFLKNSRLPRDQRNIQEISTSELQNSLNVLVCLAQREGFAQEYSDLIKKRPINNKSKLLCLNPFMDDSNLIRVGGRIQNSSENYDKKFPIILPPKHNLTKLILEHEHYRLLHCGSTMLLASIRERFWPISGRNLTKQIVHKCVVCFKVNPPTENYQMGNLPEYRVNQYLPFQNTGLDYAGPILVKDRSTRGAKLSKAYICLFVCMAVKAIHLEVVSDLTTECFLAALKRFVSRRGKPLNLFSDNAKNFVGAQAELQDMLKFLKSESNNISSQLADDGITWNFIPARSPNFGGIWEAGIKSAKFHLKRIIGNAHLTFEGLYTVSTQIEAILNSRPLYPLNSDPDQVNPLTPAHFLVGKTLTAIPEHSLVHVPENRLKYYQRLQQMVQNFWKKWHSEYLSELQTRVKWRQESRNKVKVGAIVLVKEDNVPPLKWNIGRILHIHPGQDGVVRVVTLKLNSSVVKRPVTKLCIFPFEGDIGEVAEKTIK